MKLYPRLILLLFLILISFPSQAQKPWESAASEGKRPWYVPRGERERGATVDLRFAPEEVKQTFPSPAAAKATRYSDYGVSYSLGLVDVSIPLYEVKSHSLRLPISLRYDASGVKVDDVSGPVGLGWTLDAGGVITRTVIGLDDTDINGWAHRPEGDPSSEDYTDTDHLYDLAYGSSDSSADLYSYDFCGHSGSFYIVWSPGFFKVVPTSTTDLEIEVTNDGFTISDSDGTSYDFTCQERSTTYTSITSPIYGSGSSPQSFPQNTSPITAWYLTSITAMDSTDVINIAYDTKPANLETVRPFKLRTYRFSYKYRSASDYLWLTSGGTWSSYPAVATLTGDLSARTTWSPHYVSTITYAGGQVTFNYVANPIQSTSSERRSYPYILSSMTVSATPPAVASSQRQMEATFEFQTTSDSRNLLKEVSLTGRTSSDEIESYTLSYINESTGMLRMAKDLFGYYNGATTNTTTAFLRLFNDNYTFSEPVANRSYNAYYVSNLSLESITAATGSKTKFTYEGNSISSSSIGLPFTTIGIGHRIKKIETFDLSLGSETLVREREFSYSTPGITVPLSAFDRSSFLTVTEVFSDELAEGTPTWGGALNPMPRTATVALSDQSVLPGVSLENAKIHYGNVTERVSGPDGLAGSVRTDYVFATSGAVHPAVNGVWYLTSVHDTHDSVYNDPPTHQYHFFQRPPQTVPRQSAPPSINLTQWWTHYTPSDFPQLTTPTIVRRYKRNGNTDVLVSQTTNSYTTLTSDLLTGIHIRNMIALGDPFCILDENHTLDYFRKRMSHRRVWHRLISSVESETLDDGNTWTETTYYTYVPASSDPVPEYTPVIISPKSRTTVFGGIGNVPERTYRWDYVYPKEEYDTNMLSQYTWRSGYRRAIQESITVGTGNGSAILIRRENWRPFTPFGTDLGILRPENVTISRKGPGESTTSVSQIIHYDSYDINGNILQAHVDNELPLAYVWGYGNLFPVLEVTGDTYYNINRKIGSSTMSAINGGRPTAQQLSSVRTSLEGDSQGAKKFVSWYQYNVPFGVSQASDVSGRLTSYEYDGNGRLAVIKGEDGEMVSSYSYSLPQSGTPNRLLTSTFITGGTGSIQSSMQDVVYYDGLGRTIQKIEAKASTSSKDLVIPVVPDFLDRENVREYLPYPAATSSLTTGRFRTDALNSQQAYYGSGVRAFYENTYEPSSRGRITSSSLPGFTETTDFEKRLSAADVVLNLSYNPGTGTISASGYYPAGRFIVAVTEGPDGSVTEVYSDELGTPALERVKLDASGNMADTYYIRDILGRVLCVVPPAESAKITSSTQNFSAANCFTYEYDHRDRVISLRTPGGVEETLTYNDADLPLTRSRLAADGVKTEVFGTEYDAFNRLVRKTYKYGTNTPFTMAEYWYDTYPSGAPSFSAESGYVESADKDTRTRGMATAERISLLPAGTPPSGLNASTAASKEYRAFFYDSKGRLRQEAVNNALGGTDRISSKYFFAGNLEKERQKMQPGSGKPVHTLDREYTYDSRLRLTGVSASLDGNATASQTYTYDDLQRISTINRGAGAAETTTRSYTLQGWLSSVVSTSWEETLHYASPSRTGTDALPGKVGLITEWTQQQKGSSSSGATTAETYAYSYDKAGRLTGSLRYVGTSTSGVNTLTEKGISYDKSGNLLSLSRYGLSSGSSPSETLSYSYNGPKRNSWTYDHHVNVTSDPQGGLSVAWNALDLPRTLTAGTSSTQRFYLADGTLSQISDGSTTRMYLGDMVFTKSSGGTVSLESAGWEGGRLLSGSGADKVLYNVTDHLGSVRVVKDGSGAVLQRFDYYPFGTVSRIWSSSSATDKSEKRFRFGGKEIAGNALTEVSGTGSAPAAPYLDFGARLYSPRTATWLSPDPLMEKYYGISPFSYCSSNPINLCGPKWKKDICKRLCKRGSV